MIWTVYFILVSIIWFVKCLIVNFKAQVSQLPHQKMNPHLNGWPPQGLCKFSKPHLRWGIGKGFNPPLMVNYANYVSPQRWSPLFAESPLFLSNSLPFKQISRWAQSCESEILLRQICCGENDLDDNISLFSEMNIYIWEAKIPLWSPFLPGPPFSKFVQLSSPLYKSVTK